MDTFYCKLFTILGKESYKYGCFCKLVSRCACNNQGIILLSFETWCADNKAVANCPVSYPCCMDQSKLGLQKCNIWWINFPRVHLTCFHSSLTVHERMIRE